MRNYCKDCRWWEDSAERCGTSLMIPPIRPDGKELRAGTCHLTHHFEPTAEEDWCGEFEAKPIGPLG